MYSLSRVDNSWDPYDFEKIVLLAKEFNNKLAQTGFDAWGGMKLVESAVDFPENYYLIALLYDEQIVGLLGGVKHTPAFSFNEIASEVIWYIKPEHRGSKLAIKMVKQFEEWANEQGAKYVSMVSQSNSDVDPSNLYERLGYKLSEKTYTKEL